MTTRINATLTKGRFTLRRVALRQVDLYCGDTLLERAISPIVAFAYGFGDSVEFQRVFLGV
jgi:hypothetical protein